ncbi:hypothetical protein V2J09_014953 [Rumex salicifolius]
MGDHLVVCVDHLIKPEASQSEQGAGVSVPSGGSPCNHAAESSSVVLEDESGIHDEEQPLIQVLECRICQEEDSIKNLEAPCACSGKNVFSDGAMRKGTQLVKSVISGSWAIAGAPLDLSDPRLLAMAAAERHLLESEYDEYADNNANGAAFCRSAALILMALLLLRHALTVTNPDGDEDDVSTFFSLFLLRAAGFLLPCYIMAWAISILQRRRQRQEAATLAASEVAYMIQAGQHRGLQVTIAPGPSVLQLMIGKKEGSKLSASSEDMSTVEEIRSSIEIEIRAIRNLVDNPDFSTIVEILAHTNH